jgi:ketosteroid isomerase-like protein
MSHDNVEIVRRAIESFTERDLDAALRDNDPEIEVDWSRSTGVEAGVYHGYQAVRASWSTFIDTFDPIIVTVDEFIEDGEYVVLPNRARFWGGDGIEVEADSAWVVTLRDGRIVRSQLHQPCDDALKAVRLAG